MPVDHKAAEIKSGNIHLKTQHIEIEGGGRQAGKQADHELNNIFGNIVSLRPTLAKWDPVTNKHQKSKHTVFKKEQRGQVRWFI